MATIPPHLTFQVRRVSRETLTEMGERVGRALGCTFEPSDDHRFTSGEALEASTLGLEITLSHDPEAVEGSDRTYVLMGGLRRDLDVEWSEEFAPRVSISDYMLRLLTIVDGDGWYIADRAELLAEAGLPPDEE